MVIEFEAFPHVEPELLVATFTPKGHCLSTNPAWRTLFGEGQGPWDRLLSEDRQRAAQCVRQTAAGALFTYEFFPLPVPWRDEPLPVLLNFLPVRLPGSETGAAEAVVVTGEVLRAPDTWTQSQTQRHRMETLGRMTMGIAHDFNNLLSGILGYTELLKTMLTEEGTPPALGEHLGTIEQAALDGAALVRKIQQYIRQEKLSEFEPIDLPSLLQDCITLTRPYWYNEPRRQGIAIRVETDFEEVPPVLGAPTELREVFVNLILNAVQAMPEGGTLSFRTRDKAQDGIAVSVIDTGTGMPESVRKRIFEPLYTTKGERGTGMGLAVTYGILQEHGVAIEVASRLGEGTRFTLTFPLGAPGLAAAEEAAEEPPHRAARILVVDDEPMVRAILVKLLTLKGHRVTQVASGAEGLTAVEQRAGAEDAFDVVFTDHGMPEMNGRQFARALRKRHADLPIVLLTGDTEVGEPDEEVNVVLSKPFKIDVLEATIQQLLRT